VSPVRHLIAFVAVVALLFGLRGAALADHVGRRPKAGSAAVIVLDAKDGDAEYEKNADVERSIGSLTKIFVALALRRNGLPLADYTTITADDVAESVGGARTRLAEGQTFKNLDLLKVMLMSSDNRCPTALARAVGLDRQGLLDEMHAVAADLGLTHTSFVDPTGILGNTSTAREVALAMTEVLKDKLLAELMSDSHVRIWSKDKKEKLEYRSTVQPIQDRKYKIYGGKTGHTSTAGYCMIVKALIGKRVYVMAFLGGKKKKTRVRDFERLAIWLGGVPKITDDTAVAKTDAATGTTVDAAKP